MDTPGALTIAGEDDLLFKDGGEPFVLNTASKKKLR